MAFAMRFKRRRLRVSSQLSKVTFWNGVPRLEAFGEPRLETYFVTHTVIGIGSLGKFTIGPPFGKGTKSGPTALPL